MSSRHAQSAVGFSPREWQIGVWAMIEMAALAVGVLEDGAKWMVILLSALTQCIPCDPCRVFLAQAMSTYDDLESEISTTSKALNFVYDLRATVSAKVSATRARGRAGTTGFDAFPDRSGYMRRLLVQGPTVPDDDIINALAMMALRVNDMQSASRTPSDRGGGSSGDGARRAYKENTRMVGLLVVTQALAAIASSIGPKAILAACMNRALEVHRITQAGIASGMHDASATRSGDWSHDAKHGATLAPYYEARCTLQHLTRQRAQAEPPGESPMVKRAHLQEYAETIEQLRGPAPVDMPIRGD